MNAKHFALALSFLCFSLPSIAASPEENPPTSQKVVQKIDINRADVATLSHAVKGIGPKRAEAIVKYREAHHGFTNLDELAGVRGIGKAFVQSHRAAIEAALIVGK